MCEGFFWCTVDILVAASTVVAAVLALIALVATKRQAKQIARERKLAHDRDVLKALLDLALRDDAASPGRYWKPGLAYIRTLSEETRAIIPLARRFFHHDWQVDLQVEAKARNEGKRDLENQPLGLWTWTRANEGPEGPGSPERSILATIYDELIAAISKVVAESS